MNKKFVVVNDSRYTLDEILELVNHFKEDVYKLVEDDLVAILDVTEIVGDMQSFTKDKDHTFFLYVRDHVPMEMELCYIKNNDAFMLCTSGDHLLKYLRKKGIMVW